MCGGAKPENRQGSKTLSFPGYKQRKTKQSRWAKRRQRKCKGLKWFKHCDIWFHGHSFNKKHGTRTWKERFFAQDAALGARAASLLLISDFNVGKEAAGPTGGLVPPVKFWLTWMKRKEKEKSFVVQLGKSLYDQWIWRFLFLYCIT